jgi:general secretion pathway protein K
MTRPSPPIRRAQRGAALLMALIIVTVISTLAVSMVWQQWRAVQVESAERARQQSAWILTGALAWTRIILKEDLRPSNPDKTDNLGEPWAVPLAEARLSTFLAADKDNTDDAPDTFLSGNITDAQSRFNLSNMVTVTNNVPTAVVDEVAAFQRLCGFLNLSATVAQQISKGFLESTPPHTGVANPPLRPERLDQLAWFGVDLKTIKQLEPYVVILPQPGTAVNLNTASREVIAAVAKVDLATAERMVQVRGRAHFKSVSDAVAQLGGKTELSTTQLSVASSFFIINGRLRLSNQVLEQRSLVQREGRDVRPLSREWVNSSDPG